MLERVTIDHGVHRSYPNAKQLEIMAKRVQQVVFRSKNSKKCRFLGISNVQNCVLFGPPRTPNFTPNFSFLASG